MDASHPLDICRCGCAREDHPEGGSCAGYFACQPDGCGGFKLSSTSAEMAEMFDEAVADMNANREPDSDHWS